MKKCEYCAKEISYSQQYCNSSCEGKALNYFQKVNGMRRIFSVLNILIFLLMFVGAFMLILSSTAHGALILGIGGALMGILYMLFPFGTPEQLKKYKIEKMLKINRTIALGALIAGIILLICGIFVF